VGRLGAVGALAGLAEALVLGPLVEGGDQGAGGAQGGLAQQGAEQGAAADEAAGGLLAAEGLEVGVGEGGEQGVLGGGWPRGGAGPACGP
jgi:hypothetical protein